MLFDITYLFFLIPGMLLGGYAMWKLKSTYGHYLRVPAATGITGAEAARAILNRAGLNSMEIQEVGGQLSDHYDPLRKKLCLSSDNYHGRSLAALGVAAHEAGHALQHQAAYPPLKFRMALVPLTGISSNLSVFLIIIGVIMASSLGQTLAYVGLGLFAVVALFQLITLPVEYDASRRAREQLVSLGLVTQQEDTGVRRVLNAAALTYVAALVTSLLQLLYWLSVVNRR